MTELEVLKLDVKEWAEQADYWKARALKSEEAGAAAYWSEVIGMFEARLNQGPAAVTASDVLALLGDCQYLASLGHPQPAAQEPDCATTGVCVRSGLYASPPSAVPVVEQLVEALSRNRIMAADSDGNYTREVTPRVITAAIAAGQQYLKENGK